MSLVFDSKHFRADEIEFGASGERLGCKFLVDERNPARRAAYPKPREQRH